MNLGGEEINQPVTSSFCHPFLQGFLKLQGGDGRQESPLRKKVPGSRSPGGEDSGCHWNLELCPFGTEPDFKGNEEVAVATAC
jgi:hypothetical protein